MVTEAVCPQCRKSFPLPESPAPQPAACPHCSQPLAARAAPAASTEYQRVADKIGLVPNLRRQDNLYQGLAVLGFVVAGALVGLAWGPWGIYGGALIGLATGGFISGFVLMVLGLLRK